MKGTTIVLGVAKGSPAKQQEQKTIFQLPIKMTSLGYGYSTGKRFPRVFASKEATFVLLPFGESHWDKLPTLLQASIMKMGEVTFKQEKERRKKETAKKRELIKKLKTPQHYDKYHWILFKNPNGTTSHDKVRKVGSRYVYTYEGIKVEIEDICDNWISGIYNWGVNGK